MGLHTLNINDCPRRLNGERQLFLDDADVARVENLRRTVHPLEKKGAVIRAVPGIGGTPEIRCAPAWDPEARVWKLWTCCVTPETLRYSGVGGFSGYHESADGVHWSAPRTGQVEYQGSRENNLVYIPMEDGHTAELFCVVRDATDPDPARRYKGFTHTYGDNALHFAVSPDGIVWTRTLTPPVPSQDEPNFNFEADAHRFILTVKQPGPYGRSHALSTSTDFAQWTPPELIFHADAADQELAQEIIARHIADPLLQQPFYHHPQEYGTDVYNFAVSRYESRYLGFASFFYHTGLSPRSNIHDGFHHVQLAVSPDLKNWTRVGDRQPYIQPSPLGAGAYDTLQIIGPSRPIRRGEELWFYYSGIRRRHAPEGASIESGICLATLRRDGFISLDAGDEEGVLTTTPFLVDGDAVLHLNADAGKGMIACELLDASGQPLPGFGRADAVPISTNGTDMSVTWRRRDRLPTATTQPMHLRVYLRNARLYSYWAE